MDKVEQTFERLRTALLNQHGDWSVAVFAIEASTSYDEAIAFLQFEQAVLQGQLFEITRALEKRGIKAKKPARRHY